MGLNVKAWNLGGLVGLVAGCGGDIVPAGEGDAPTSTDTNDDEDPSAPEGLDPQCESDDDCGYGQECRDGVCEYAPYCSTCCDDECNEPDSGEVPECLVDTDCPEGDRCFEGACVPDGDLPQCGDLTFDVQSLPIPGGNSGANLVFVRDAGGGPDRLVVADDTRITVVAPDGTMESHEGLPASSSPRSIAVGDFDGDGDDEIMVEGTTGTIDDPGRMEVYEIDSGAPELVATSPGTAWNPVVGDFDGDGADDVLTFVVDVGQSIYAAQGDGTFAPSVALDWFGVAAAVADVDGDGRDEIITDVGEVMGVGDDFVLETRFELASMQPTFPVASVLADDFDDDGTRELLVARGWPAWLEHNDTSGALVSTFAVPEGTAPMESAVLGGASARDLALRAAVVLDPIGSPCVLSYTEPDGVQRAAAGDWDGDGRDEIVFKHEYTYEFALARLPASR